MAQLEAAETISKIAEALWAANGFAEMHPEGFQARPDHVRQSYIREAAGLIGELQKRGYVIAKDREAGGESKRHYTRADYDAAPEDGAGREPPSRP